MIRKLLLAVTLSACAAMAFAIPKPSEVKAAVASGNYAKAESMLLEVMKEKPSARAHYDLGQVYTFEGKHKDALNEYRQAQALDPSLKFASTAAEFTKKLATAQTLVAPAPVVVAQNSMPVFPATPPVSFRVDPPVQHESSGGSGSGIIVGLLVLLVFGGVAAFFLMRKKVTDDVAEKTGISKDQMNNLLGMAKQLEDSVLIAKTSVISEDDRKLVLGRITALQTNVRNTIAEIKDGKGCTAVTIARLQALVDQVVDESQNGIKVAAVATPAAEHSVEVAREYAPRAEANVAPPTTSAWGSAPKPMFPSPAPAPTVFHHYHPAPAPVVVQNNSGDLLTGVLIGEALSNHHDRTVYVEREVPRRVERDEYVAAPAPAPTYYAPAPAPAATFDSNDDTKDDYEAPSSSVDTSDSSDSDSY